MSLTGRPTSGGNLHTAVPARRPERLFQAGVRVLEYLIGAGLFVMFGLVLLNAVLRYAFSSGIAESEELARLIFIWITMIGSVVVLVRNEHLGMGRVIRNPVARAGAELITALSMLVVLWLLFEGSWVQTIINQSNTLSGTGLQASWLYYPGMISAVLMGGVVGYRGWQSAATLISRCFGRRALHHTSARVAP